MRAGTRRYTPRNTALAAETAARHQAYVEHTIACWRAVLEAGREAVADAFEARAAQPGQRPHRELVADLRGGLPADEALAARCRAADLSCVLLRRLVRELGRGAGNLAAADAERNWAVTTHRRLALYALKRLRRRHRLDHEDAEAIATFDGLASAWAHWDPARGAWTSCALAWCHQAVTRASEMEGSLIRLPSHALYRGTKESTRENVERAQRICSLDAPVGDGETTRGELLPDTAEAPDELTERADLIAHVRSVVTAELPEREAAIVLRDEDETLEVVAGRVGISRARAGQIALDAQRRLARRLRDLAPAATGG